MALTQTLRCQVTLNPQDDPKDWVVNTWHVATQDATAPVTAADSFIAGLDAFYQAIDAVLSADMNAKVPNVSVYNLSDPKPRVPLKSYALTALTTGNGRLPREIASCVSYQAQYTSGVSPRRRRGRIYIGPIYGSAVDSATGLFTSSFVGTLSDAADTLITLSDGGELWRWVVYSPTTDTAGTGTTGMFEVIGGYVDTLPDVQRRRGLRSGSRDFFSP